MSGSMSSESNEESRPITMAQINEIIRRTIQPALDREEEVSRVHHERIMEIIRRESTFRYRQNYELPDPPRLSSYAQEYPDYGLLMSGWFIEDRERGQTEYLFNTWDNALGPYNENARQESIEDSDGGNIWDSTHLFDICGVIEQHMNEHPKDGDIISHIDEALSEYDAEVLKNERAQAERMKLRTGATARGSSSAQAAPERH